MRHLLALAAFGLALTVASAAAPTPVPKERTEGLSLYDQALLHHTTLEPVVRGQRIMAGENDVAAADASPTPGVTQNGICNDQKPEAQVGETRIFWVHNFKLGMDIQKTFVLAAKTPHVYMWVDVTQDGGVVSRAQAQTGAERFESIYATDREYFGREAQCDQLPDRQPPRLEQIWGTPWYDADDDRHINIVNFDPDVGATVVAGYYSSADEYPKTVNAHSNEGEFFYMNSLLFNPGGTTYASILAHEFYHMIQFANDANEETWVNEGMADVAIEVTGFGGTIGSHTGAYANTPEDQLTDWDGQLYDYGNAYSFFSYFLEHYGPPDDPATPFKENYALAKEITQVQTDGLEGLDEILGANPYKGGLAPSYRDNTANDVYLDRAVANVVNDRTLADGQYGYGQLAGFTVNPHGAFSSYPAEEDGNETLTDPARGRVYGDRIYAFESSADGSFRVDAPATIPVVPNEEGMPSPSHFLWLNRGDEMLTFAVRDADLSGAAAPRLQFGYWYDIEEDFDYAYVQVSEDGGATWTNLACCGSRTTNPNGNNEGNGITARSGAVLPTDGASWQQADVDLSAFAGQQVEIRFAYVTDPAVTRPGFTVDDVRLVDGGTAIWPLEDFEGGAGAFELGGNGAKTALVIESRQSNRLALQLVKLGRGVEVSRHDGAAGGGTVSAQGPMDAFRTIAIFSSLTPVTSERYGYTWRAEASPYADPTPPELTATGGSRIELSWTAAGNAGSRPPLRYVVQESTSFAEHFREDAESGFDGWSRNVPIGSTPWSESTAKKRSGNLSFFAQGVEHTSSNSILTLVQPLQLPAEGRSLLRFWDWAINEPDDATIVEVSTDNGATWQVVYSASRAVEADLAAEPFATEPLTERVVDLSGFAGQTLRLRFRYATGGSNFFFYTPYGWYVDDVEVVTESWETIAEPTGTSYTVEKSAPGTFFYRVSALYTETAQGPWSNVASAEAQPVPDLSIGDFSLSSTKARGGDVVTFTATVRNLGAASAANVLVRFTDDGQVIGEETIASIPAGGSATATAEWEVKGKDGEHTILVTADPEDAIEEDDEDNNSASAQVTVQGNKIRNASFEESSSGASPDGWTASGDTSYSQEEGTASAGPGGSWTSDPVGVEGGKSYELVVSSTGGAPLVTVETPLGALALVDGLVTIPAGVTEVRVRLVGGVGGTMFEHVGLFET